MTHPIDYAAITARIAEQRARETAFTQGLREIAKVALNGTGAASVSANYHGEGDSGAIEDIALSPDTLPDPESITVRVDLSDPCCSADTLIGEVTLYRLLDMLFMSLVCSRHPCWEINSGGYGDIHWCLDEDVIHVDHASIVTHTEHDCFDA